MTSRLRARSFVASISSYPSAEFATGSSFGGQPARHASCVVRASVRQVVLALLVFSVARHAARAALASALHFLVQSPFSDGPAGPVSPVGPVGPVPAVNLRPTRIAVAIRPSPPSTRRRVSSLARPALMRSNAGPFMGHLPAAFGLIKTRRASNHLAPGIGRGATMRMRHVGEQRTSCPTARRQPARRALQQGPLPRDVDGRHGPAAVLHDVEVIRTQRRLPHHLWDRVQHIDDD